MKTSGPGARAAWFLLALGGLLHVVFLLNLGTRWLDPLFVEARGAPGQGADLFGIWGAGDNLLGGHSIYGSQDYRGADGLSGASPRVPYDYFYRYLPATAYVAAVVARFVPPWPAYWAWVAANELFLALLLLSMARARGARPVKCALAGMTLGFFPFALEQWMGQFSFLMACFLWMTAKPELERNAPPERGALDCARRVDFWGFTSALGLKNYPALLAFTYLRQGRWRRIALSLGIVALVSLPYYASRPEDLSYFLKLNLRPFPPALHQGTYSMPSLIRGLACAWMGSAAGREVHLGVVSIHASSIPVALWALLVVAVSLLATFRWKHGGSTADGLALWTLAFFLIFKDVWEYHHVMLLPVVYALALRGPPAAPLVLGGLLALPTPFALYAARWEPVPAASWPAGLILLHYGSKALPTLGLYLLTLRRLRNG